MAVILLITGTAPVRVWVEFPVDASPRKSSVGPRTFGVAKRIMESLCSSSGTPRSDQSPCSVNQKIPDPMFLALNFYLEKEMTALFSGRPTAELSDDEER